MIFDNNQRIIQNKVRKIGIKNSSLSGSFYSIKVNDEVSFESSLERDFIYLLEMDPLVSKYCEQPLKIIFKDVEEKDRSYTPDFLVFYENAVPTLCEIKYKKDLRDKWDILKPKFRAALDYCKNKGYNFRIVCEDNIRGIYLDNAKFLYRYRGKLLTDNQSDVALLLKIISDLKITSPAELIQVASRDIKKQAELIYIMWHLVAFDIISCDWRKPFTMDMEILIKNPYPNANFERKY